MFRRIRRTRKPPLNVPINRASWLFAAHEAILDFREGAGTTTRDTRRGIDNTITGGTWIQDPQSGVTGSASFFVPVGGGLFGAGNFTWTVVCRSPTNTPAQVGEVAITSYDSVNPGYMVMYPFDNFTGNGIRWEENDNSGANLRFKSSNIADDQIHIVTFKRESATSRKVFVDGKLVTHNTNSLAYHTPDTSQIGYYPTTQRYTQDMYMALIAEQALPDDAVVAMHNQLYGLLYQPRKVFLSSASAWESKVREHFDVAWWRLGESSGTTVNEEITGSAPGFVAQYYGSVSLGESGMVTNDPDTCISLDQTSPEHLSIATSGGKVLDTAGSSIGSGVSLHTGFATTDDSRDQILWLFTAPNAQRLEARIEPQGGGVGRLLVRLYDGTTPTRLRLEGYTDLSLFDGVDRQLIVAFDPSTDMIYIWIDGVSRSITYVYQETPTTFGDFTFGTLFGGSSSTTYFEGRGDEFAIGMSVLTQSDVNDIYLTWNGGKFTFGQMGRGASILRSTLGHRGRGNSAIRTQLGTTGRGIATINNSFGQQGRGQSILRNTFGSAGRGNSAIRNTMGAVARGLNRLANEGIAGYYLYVGSGAAPTITDGGEDEYNATRPYTHALAPAGAGLTVDYYLVERLRNQWGLYSETTSPTIITIDENGAQVVEDPSTPIDLAIANISGLKARITARYAYAGDDPTPGSADTWLLWITTDGSTPDPASDPVTATVTMVKADGVARLSYETASLSDPTTVKARVGVRRTSDSAQTVAATLLSVTVTADAPNDIDDAKLWFGDDAIQYPKA